MPKPTAACWYLGEGETPGAIAHSQRPSLCLARPYALANGCKQKNQKKLNPSHYKVVTNIRDTVVCKI